VLCKRTNEQQKVQFLYTALNGCVCWLEVEYIIYFVYEAERENVFTFFVAGLFLLNFEYLKGRNFRGI